LIKALGLNAYRFSVEWSKIEPREGVFDTTVIRHYQDMCDSLRANGIEPVVTLHHVTNPIWFEKKGAFEKEENLPLFTDFVRHIVLALGDRVNIYCTINEPAVYAMESYFTGAFPPGKQDPQMTALVLRNLLIAHVMSYQTIKQLPGGEKKRVGIVKNITLVDPYNPWLLTDWIFSSISDKAFNGVVLEFFRTGKYDFNMPGMARLKYEDPEAVKTLDFFGLNYYSHYTYHLTPDLESSFGNKVSPGEIMTDMEYTIYPEGFYRAIKRVAVLGVPVIVTENGIADHRDDRRELFIRRNLYALSRAIREGYDVRGYFYWSLLDNFEWNEGYEMKFGLYRTDFTTQERSLRPGARVYGEIVKRFSSPQGR
jgi:beta-glucosidase